MLDGVPLGFAESARLALVVSGVALWISGPAAAHAQSVEWSPEMVFAAPNDVRLTSPREGHEMGWLIAAGPSIGAGLVFTITGAMLVGNCAGEGVCTELGLGVLVPGSIATLAGALLLTIGIERWMETDERNGARDRRPRLRVDRRGIGVAW